jgi:hypothetical protein
MKHVLLVSMLLTTLTHAAEPKILFEDNFTAPLSKDWHWGLGGDSRGPEGEKAGALSSSPAAQ